MLVSEAFIEHWLAFSEASHALLLYIPLALATFFIFKFFAGDQEAARGSLPMACLFAIGTFVAVSIWTIIYICCIYKEPVVYTAPEPWHEDAYRETSKK